jgi:hypothetical protein
MALFGCLNVLAKRKSLCLQKSIASDLFNSGSSFYKIDASSENMWADHVVLCLPSGLQSCVYVPHYNLYSGVWVLEREMLQFFPEIFSVLYVCWALMRGVRCVENRGSTSSSNVDFHDSI